MRSIESDCEPAKITKILGRLSENISNRISGDVRTYKNLEILIPNPKEFLSIENIDNKNYSNISHYFRITELAGRSRTPPSQLELIKMKLESFEI